MGILEVANVPATLDELVAETEWLRRLATSLVKDQSAADDLVHDTVLVAAERAPRDGRPLRPWLVRVLLNRVRMRHRRDARRGRREKAVAELAIPPATPEAIVDRIELQRMLAGFVLELAQPLLDVVLLHYFEGLSSVAIGNRLGLADSTVRWRLKQAIDELRDRLEQRAPNRAWVPTLAALPGAARGTEAAGAGTFAVAAVAALLALVAVIVLAWHEKPSATTPAPRAHAELVAARARDPEQAASTPSVLTVVSGTVAAASDIRQLTGMVRDSSGRPVADAVVRIHTSYRVFNGFTTTARTANNGTFGFELERGLSVTITALKGDTVATRAMGDRFDGPVVLTLAPAAITVFRVLDAETDVPIAGAQVTSRGVFDDSMQDAATTDTQGVARIRSLAGSNAEHHHATLVVIAAPLYVETEWLNRSPGASESPSERTIRLARGIAFSGTVIGPDGPGVSDAAVEVIDDHGRYWHAMADTAGTFSVRVPRAGRYRARAHTATLVERKDAPAIEVGADGLMNIVIPLQRRGEITGTVVNASGQPVAGARVRAAGHEVRSMVTDTRGGFAFSLGKPELDSLLGGVPARRLFLLASYGSLTSTFHLVDVHDEYQSANITLPLGPAGIAGSVVDLDGAPLPHADVWLNFCCGKDQLVDGRHVEADEDGRFAFDVPRGDFVLSVRRSYDDDFDERDDRAVSGGTHDVRMVVP